MTRVLAPLALVAVLIAVIVVVNSSMGNDDGDTSKSSQADGSGASTTTKDASGGGDEGPSTPKTYVIESGDSLSSIAVKFGVSVDRLERLNPDVDPNALPAGQELTLR